MIVSPLHYLARVVKDPVFFASPSAPGKVFGSVLVVLLNNGMTKWDKYHKYDPSVLVSIPQTHAEQYKDVVTGDLIEIWGRLRRGWNPDFKAPVLRPDYARTVICKNLEPWKILASNGVINECEDEGMPL